MTVSERARDGEPAGRSRRTPRELLHRLVPLGPAFVAAVAYVDPGNVATNVTAGVVHGYLLCWVVVAASAMAMLVQHLSATLGLATGSTLPALCRTRYPRPVSLGLWVQAEVVALATELAEVLGGAIALQLLFGLSPALGSVLVAAASVVILLLQRSGRQRPFEAVIGVLLAVCAAGFVLSALRAGPSVTGLAAGIVPRFDGAGSLVLAAGIIGATVMPHAIYLHSALVRDRFGLTGPPVGPGEVRRRAQLARSGRVDVLLALGSAAAVNLCLMVVAAAALRGVDGTDTLQGAVGRIGAVLGPATWALFCVGLLASGLASTCVGAYAGAVVLEGFTGRRFSPTLRRALTLVPVLLVISAGVDPTRALIVSQVMLSLGIPFVLWPLIGLTRDRAVMGTLVSARSTTILASAVALVVTALVSVLAWQTVRGG